MWAGLQLELACTVRYKGVWVIPPLVSRNTKRIPQTKLLDDDADDVRQWVVARSNISSAGSVCACYFPAHLTESCTWLCSVYCVVILSRVANVTGLSPNVVTFLAGRRGQRFRGCLLEGGRLGEIIDRGGHGETPNPNRSQERRAFLPSWQRLAWWLLSCTGWGTGMLQDVATKTQLRVLNPPPPPRREEKWRTFGCKRSYGSHELEIRWLGRRKQRWSGKRRSTAGKARMVGQGGGRRKTNGERANFNLRSHKFGSVKSKIMSTVAHHPLHHYIEPAENVAEIR